MADNADAEVPGASAMQRGRSQRSHVGRQVNLQSKRQKILATRALNKAAKVEDLLSEVSCTWESSTRGGLRQKRAVTCCVGNCKERYAGAAEGEEPTETQVVQALRAYYNTLSASNKRLLLLNSQPFVDMTTI